MEPFSDDFVGYSVEWTYTPEGFFEAPLLVRGNGYLLEATAGIATAQVYGDVEEQQGKAWEDRLDMLMRAWFTASQLIDPRKFTLQQSGATLYRRDGSRTVSALFQGCYSIERPSQWSELTPEQRADRQQRMRELAMGLARHSCNDELVRLVSSFQASVEDPENSFVHLYEIKELLRKLLDESKDFAIELGVNDASVRQYISSLGNDAIRQGRHRGKHIGKLRNATLHEVRTAQDLALQLIEGYVRRLDERAI